MSIKCNVFIDFQYGEISSYNMCLTILTSIGLSAVALLMRKVLIVNIRLFRLHVST